MDRQEKKLRVTSKCKYDHNHLPEVKAAGKTVKKLTLEPSKRAKKILPAKMPSPEFTATYETEDDYENKNSKNTDGNLDNTASSSEAFDQRDHRETNPRKKKRIKAKKSNLPATMPSPKLPVSPAIEDNNENQNSNNTDGSLDSTASSSEASDQRDRRKTDPEKKEEIKTIEAKKLTINKQNLSAQIDVSKITGTSEKKDEFDNKEMFTTWNLKPSGIIEVSETLEPKIPLVANQGRPKKRTRAIKLISTNVDKDTDLGPNKKRRKIAQQQEKQIKKFSTLTVEEKSEFLLNLLVKKDVKTSNEQEISLEEIKKISRVKTMPHAITASRLKIVRGKLSENAYKYINRMIKKRTDEDTWYCGKCRKSISGNVSTECECCLRWFCSKCEKQEEKKKKVWFCSECEKTGK
ncbi:hypothetical protein KQX54_013342 [Cotesia glomerata]|uniref:Uncharacterized protein n=2 Tax=Cotesia glomerata TaxID=32391 RepID=A0AAV7IV66_COTGL|nr:hypothetical protein KQX54_013342 [Cotesia glomerata]